ncbi:MAG: cupin domain-containing protein [Acidimicrobiales bacterium]
MLVPARGRLLDSSLAPVKGERVERVVQVGETLIEQILSGELDKVLEFDQDLDEWVVVLRGAAVLEVDGERLSLEQGDWVLLPRRTRHRLVQTARGTSWLAVHLPGE